MVLRDYPGVERVFFKAGEVLIKAGEPVEYVYQLVHGLVYRVVVSEAGNETIMSRKTEHTIGGALIGVLLLFSKQAGEVSTNEFVAQTDCVCYRVPKAVCLQYLRSHVDVMEEVLRMAMDEYRQLADKYYARCEKSVPAQLCGFLLNYSVETAQGRVLLKKHTNVEIAKSLSIHRVTVSNMLRALKDQGCVERTPEGLALTNISLLKAFAANEQTLNY